MTVTERDKLILTGPRQEALETKNWRQKFRTLSTLMLFLVLIREY